jgi:phage anti-repressor protein
MEAIMRNPKVVTAGNGFEDNVKQDLALVFIKAFDDKGNQFPINFDDVWRFLEYSNKASALRKLKSPQFMEGEDYTVSTIRDTNIQVENLRSVDLGGRPVDTYMLTTNAFEHFAMSAPGAMGHRVRRFYIACRDSYLENEAARRQQAPKVADQAWNQARQDGIFLFHAKSGSVKNYLDPRPDVGRPFYGEVNTLINQAILGFQEQTHEFKIAHDIPK